MNFISAVEAIISLDSTGARLPDWANGFFMFALHGTLYRTNPNNTIIFAPSVEDILSPNWKLTKANIPLHFSVSHWQEPPVITLAHIAKVRSLSRVRAAAFIKENYDCSLLAAVKCVDSYQKD